MRKREEYPAGVPCWVDTAQPDPDAALAFYGGLFGWDFDPRESDGVTYNIARLHGLEVAGIGPVPDGMPGPPAWTTYVCVQSADDAAAKVRDAGGTVIGAPFDVGDAGRMAIFADTAGASFSVWQPGETIGAQLVNDPGTWNFSGLVTRDIEGAKRFYGQVFGWEAGVFDEAADNFFWRVPGYGEFLEGNNPGTIEGMKEMGAPDGFWDAVAWVQPLDDEQAEPHWSVVFAVDDADATAAKAEELGGTVVMPPTDMPWVRSTVIADPQGTTFTANRFVSPES